MMDASSERLDLIAIGCFLLILSLTFYITFLAARRTASAEQFFTAGKSITGFQNGLALAGDYISAASFLGIAGMVAVSGFDGLVYAVSALVGWPIMLLFVAEKLRRLGRYTIADVLAVRLDVPALRVAAALSTLVVVGCYLISQMVGAGHLIELLFGINFIVAEIIVGAVMLIYVFFGGMLATTWVQIIKAVLMISGAAILCGLVLAPFQFNPLALFAAAGNTYGDAVLGPGQFISNPWDGLSLGLAYLFGVAGLPHVVMRFYTVADDRAARRSAFYATGWIGLFYLMTFVLGFGAMVAVGRDVVKAADAGGNMAVPLLAAFVGGHVFAGFIAAVAFATILAVVAGLVLSGSATVSHDLWAGIFHRGPTSDRERMLVARITAVVLATLAVALGILFRDQNVGFMAGLAVGVAAAANFPALALALFWPRLTARGAIASIIVGVVSSVLLIVASPTVQIDMLHNTSAWFPLRNPGLVAIPLAFATGILVSLLDRRLGLTYSRRSPSARPAHASSRLDT